MSESSRSVAFPGEPFTIEHFRAWASEVVLDDGNRWQPEAFQLAFLEDVFAGHAECWLVVPEGNGKTTMVAGLALYHCEFTDEASVPVAASSREQAEIMFRQAEGMVGRSPRLRPLFKCQEGYRRIKGLSNGSRIQVFAADDRTGDGLIPTLALLDELHRHQSLRLYRTWRGKLLKRRGQLATISTAGVPGSEFEETRDRIRDMAEDRKQEGSFLRAVAGSVLLHEWAVPLDGDVEDMEVVKAANPFTGVTVEALREKRSSPTMTLPHWKRFTCNVAAETSAELFIEPADWDALADGEDIDPLSSVCIGADGSRTWDTTVVAWATTDSDRIDVDCRVFSVRQDAAHHVRHQGGKIDFDDVEGFLVDLFDQFSPQETAYDPRYLDRSMELVDARLPDACIFPVEPGSKHMRDAYQALYTAVIDGKLRHKGDRVIAAHLANCTVERDERTREIRRIRKIDPRKPIDAVPALALAVWRASVGSTYLTTVDIF